MNIESDRSSYAGLLADATGLLARNSESPRLDAEILLRHAAGLDRVGLLVAMRDPVTDEIRTAFEQLVERRVSGTPVAYLTGHREFMGLDFIVNEHVLIPRPETELLVEWALKHVDRFPQNLVRVADVGSGSGTIALSLVSLSPKPIDMTAVEPSRSARNVIARNRDALLSPDQESAFHIVDDDLLSTTEGPFEMVLANLPYLTPDQIVGNPDLAAEPRLALEGGIGGLDLVERLIGQLPDRLARSFAVGLEIDPSQRESVAAMTNRALPTADIDVINDYAGHARHVVATRIDH